MFTWPVSCWASTGAWLWATLMFIEWSRCDSLSQCATFQSIGYSENVNIATDLLTPAESPTLWQMICIINRTKKSSFVWCSPLPFENHALDLIASNESAEKTREGWGRSRAHCQDIRTQAVIHGCLGKFRFGVTNSRLIENFPVTTLFNLKIWT